MILKKTYQKLWDYIRRYRSFVITAHVAPDPDAICCELAMAKFLRSMGKQVVIVNDEEVPDRFKFLPGTEKIRKYSDFKDTSFEVALVLDSGELKRTGRVRKLFSPDKVVINIDHHMTSHLFGRLNVVRANASSTAEVIFDFLKYRKFTLDKTMAGLLYVGIMTDTGSFRYENTSAHTHAVVAELMEFGLVPASFYRKVYETVPLSDFKYFTRVVCRLEIFEQGRVIGLQLPKRIVRRFSEEFDLRDKLFRELRAIKGVQVVFILTEEKRNSTKINLRSHGPVNVGRIAVLFGGGGHRKASGCQVNLSMTQTKTAVLKQIRKVL